MKLSMSGWKTHPVYTRIAIVGLLLIALSSLVFIILALITLINREGSTEASTLGVFIISIVLSVIFAGLVWRFGRSFLLSVRLHRSTRMEPL